MSQPTETPWEILCRLLKECGATMTFSINCSSGIIHLLGKDKKCNCWRCRKGRGEEVTEETEAQAAQESAAAQKAQRQKMKDWFEKQKATKE